MDSSYDILFQKYTPIIKSIARRYFTFASRHGVEYQDLVQEGYLGLNSAITTYRDNVKTIFYALSLISVNHLLYHYVTYNSSSLISTKNIDSIVHQYKATAIVEDFLKTQDKYHLYTNALNERKYYVMSLFKSFLGARYGNLIITKYKCRYKFYLQKIKNLSHLIFNK